jgi:hypothetical protein
MRRLIALVLLLLIASGCSNSQPPLAASSRASAASASAEPAFPTIDLAKPSPTVTIEPPTPSIEAIPSPTILRPTATPHQFVSGGVEILNDCCINAVDGDTISIRLRFSPTIVHSSAMRVVQGSGSAIMNQPIAYSEPWTPVVAEITYDVSASTIADSRYAVCVEYRDDFLNISPTSCDEIEITVMCTPTPIPSPTPVLPVGSIEMPAQLTAALGNQATGTAEIQVRFAASSPFGAITAMRVRTEFDTPGSENMEQYHWEPFVETKTYTTGAAFMQNIRFERCVQYRDEQGNLSQVYCGISYIEGM